MHIALHFFVWPIALASGVAVAVLPHWIHAIDEAPSRTLDANGSVPGGGTRNVVLAGIPRTDAAVLKTSITRMNSSNVHSDERVLVPVVSETWKRGEPVRFILSTAARDLKQDDALVRADAGVVQIESWKGSIRNALWEGGFSTKERDLFASAGTPLSADAVLVDVGTSDWLWSYGATGAAFFAGLFVAEGIRQRKAKGTNPT